MTGPTLSGPKKRKSLLDHYEQVYSSILESNTVYSAFELVGRLPVQREPDLVDYTLKPGELRKFMTEEQIMFLDDLRGNFVISKSTNRTLDISVRKMDKLPCYDFQQYEFHNLACELLGELYAPVLSAVPMGINSVLTGIDATKSPGLVLVKAGYRNKLDVILDGYLDDFYDERLLYYRPIWKACGKVELRTFDKYVIDESQRTFIVEPFELLFHRKRLFGMQNEQMKMFRESYYGFNPYEGGVNELGQALSRFRRKWMWDAVKWDRLFPHMTDVYALKNKFLTLFSADPWLEWVISNGISSRIMLPNGDIVDKHWGNNSGSGSTTVDNILGMLIIIYHIYLICCGGNKTLARDNAMAACFGDDVVGGDNFTWISDERMRSIITDTFGYYGIVLDPLIITESVEDLEFLGFQFVSCDGVYIPKYKIGRLAASFDMVSDKVTVEGEMSKMFSLLIMSAGNGEDVYDHFREMIKHILLNCPYQGLDRFRSLYVPTYDDTISWYKGLESERSFNFFDEFAVVLSLQEEGKE